MKICFAIYMLGMAVLATFEPSVPVAHDTLRPVSVVRESAVPRSPTMSTSRGPSAWTEAAVQR